MTTITDLFTELLFGAGVWYGLPILIAVFLLVAISVKYSSVIFFVVLLLLGFEYFDRVTGQNLNAWFGLICWGASAFLMAIFYDRDLKK